MVRALVLATLAVVISPAAAGQTLGVLHIKVVLLDADRKADAGAASCAARQRQPGERAAPPARHGSGRHRRRQPAARQLHGGIGPPGRVPGQGLSMDADGGYRRRPRRGARADGRERGGRGGRVRELDRRLAADWRPIPRSSCRKWQDSVVAVWTPTTQASGFVVDATRARDDEPARDRQREVGGRAALVVGEGVGEPSSCRIPRVTSRSSGSIRRRSRRCGPCRSDARRPRDRTWPTGRRSSRSAFRSVRPKGMSSGTVNRVEQHAIASDFILAAGTLGGPVFTADGGVIGLTSVAGSRGTARDAATLRVVLRARMRARSSRRRRRR